MSSNLIKPTEVEAFWSPKPTKGPQPLKKQYLEKVFASRSREVKNHMKPKGSNFFGRKRYQENLSNPGQMKDRGPESQKGSVEHCKSIT